MLSIKLVITICQVANASVCKDITAEYDGDPKMLTPYSCALKAQTQIPGLMQIHPGWVVTRYKCTKPVETDSKGKGPKIDA